jgi:transposase
MTTTTTPIMTGNPAEIVLAMSFELGVSQWKMAFSTGLGQPPRIRSVAARDLVALAREIAQAKTRFGLPAETRVVSCYEAGRDGFWIHRALLAMGVENQVVDSASIEVSRRGRRPKTDRLDAGKLVGMLLRWLAGDKRVWKVVRAPTVEEEDRRQLHRELITARRDRTRVTNRIKSLLFAQGIHLTELGDLPRELPSLELWDGSRLPRGLVRRLEREWTKLLLLTEKVRELLAERRTLLRTAHDPGTECARKLLQLGAIGPNAAWLFALEFFSWREFKNRRQIGALAGLTPTPFQSGEDSREQGICKAGNRWVRALAIEIAWCWLRYQPESELSQWYWRRFGHGSKRLRKIGIVALARRLLIELWKYLDTGTPPAGARLKKNALRAA